MSNKSKFILSSLFIAASSLTFLVGCNDSKPTVTGFNVTYHPGAGYKMNGQDEFTSSNVTEVAIEPTPDFTANRRFVGWFNDSGLTGEKVSFPLKVTANTNLYAKWAEDYAEGVTVSFDANGGKDVPNYIIKKGGVIECSPFTSKKHYEFLGWKESSNGDYILFPYIATHDASLVADWKQVEFKVNFHTEGSGPESTTKESGKLIYKSNEELSVVETAPTTRLAGSSFLGWFETEDGSEEDTPVQFPYNVDSEHKDLYARFSDKTGVTLKLIDKVNDKKEEITNCLSIPYAPKPIATNNLKKFDGWSLTENGEVIKDYSVFKELKEDKTLYAIWSNKEVVKVNYYDDDSKLIDTIDYCKGDTIQEAPKFNKKDYFDFYGWKTSKEGSEYITFPYTVNDNLNLYCDSKRNSFDIEIVDSEEDNKGLHTVLDKKNKVSSFKGFDSSISIPGREDDYKFDHYYVKNNSGQEESIQTDSEFNLSNVTNYIKDNTVTVYTKWKERQYLVSIKYEDGTVETIKTSKEIKYNELPQRETEFEKVAYWKDENNIEYGQGKTETIPLREIKLTAVMESKFKSVNVHRGGAEEPTFSSVEKVSNLKKDSAKFSDIPVDRSKHPNYELVGFYIEDPLSNENAESKTLDELIENVTEVWEKWEHKTADVVIKYFDRNENLLKTESKEKILTVVKYSNIKTNIDDYSPYSVSVNDGDPIYFSAQQDPTLNLTKSNNEIKVVMDKILFTITYKLPYRSGEETHIESHCTEMVNYSFTLPEGVTWDNKWYDEFGNEVTIGTTLSKDITVHAQFEYPSETFDVKFNVGSTQLLAKFIDGSKTKTLPVNGTLSTENYPVATCLGNKFDGWYDSEGNRFDNQDISSEHRPVNDTIYARWKPLDGYLSMLLKLGEDGIFTSSNTDTGLMTIKSGTKWKEVKEFVPDNSYQGGEYEVDSWYYIENGKQVDVNDETVFDKSDFLYARKKQKLTKASDFGTDTWAVVSAVARNDSRVLPEGKKFNNGLEALKGVYNDLVVGSERNVQIGEYEEIVRVIGLGQDYGDSKCSKKLPITFEFSKLFDVSAFDTSSGQTWTSSTLKKKCDTNGEYFNKLPLILQETISTTYKYSNKSSTTAHQLFIPSYYEICCATNYNYNKNEFKYKLYSDNKTSGTLSDVVMKEYLAMGYCSYWVRDGGQKYLKIIRNTDGSLGYQTSGSSTNLQRGIALMFCLGNAY